MGYSVGRWESDVLVVETVGFNDDTWLDGSGHPHSDPKAYAKPLTYTQPQRLLADTELLEYICAENAKEIGRGR